MNRIIKFRYWDKRDGWCGAFSVHQTGLVRFGDTPPIWQTPEEAGGVLMQFTGLLDKNGKEIFEGDVIKVIGEQHYGGLSDGAIIEVQWECNSWDIFSTCGKCGNNFLEPEYCEVIGNIYENPELIK